MKKQLNIFLATLSIVTTLTACGTEELTLSPDAISPATTTSGEFNSLGVSNKTFSLAFKAKMSTTEIQALETKYKTKFKKVIPQIGIAIADKPENTDITELSQNFKAESTVEDYEPINLVRLEDVESTGTTESFFGGSGKKQYHLDLINATKAWNVTTGRAKIKIALVDTGIDLGHPDLKNKLVTGTNIVDPGKAPMDDNGHGTHVAGIAGASTDTKAGISGVAPDCALMPIKVLKNGKGTDVDIAEGIVWAADHGADVINISIGLYTKSTAMDRAVKYAINKNVVVVSSAGNDSKSSKIHLPSMIKGVIEVSATTKLDKFASFSNYAQQISVSAPGDNIYSTMPTYNVELTSEAGGKGYGVLSGTSMASPMVAGLAALLKSQDKNLTPKQIKAKIEASSVDLGKKGYDEYFGNGRIDLFQTLK